MLEAHPVDNPRERFTTMSIATHGVSTVANRDRIVPGRSMNRIDDIDGAQPRATRFVAKPDLMNTRDIRGATPKKLHKTPRNKPCYITSNEDIDGSIPHPYTFKTNRHLNPLEPEYRLDVPDSRPPTAPKFLRDTTKIDDIQGTKPRHRNRWATRDTMNTKDIEGAQAGWKPAHKRRHGKARDNMDVSDITKKGFRTKRVTDALDPTHVINGMVITSEPGMKPKGLPSSKNAPFYSLTTHDIEGARAGWKPKHEMGGIAEESRRHFRNINFVSDIQGTAAGSKVAGIRTKRVTDPNNPVYPLLDGRVHTAPATPAAEQRQLLDPKDAEIDQLRATVNNLKKDLEITRLQAEVDRLRSRPQTGASQRSRASAGSRAPSRGSRAGMQTSQSDRYVLRSADGRPRVPMTPGSQQSYGSRPPTGASFGRRSNRDIAPQQRPESQGSRQLTAASLASLGGGQAFGAGSRGDAASVASFASAASVRDIHSAYSQYSRASARSKRSRASRQLQSRRGATPSQRRAAQAGAEDFAAVMALPDRPPSAGSALSRAGSAALSME